VRILYLCEAVQRPSVSPPITSSPSAASAASASAAATAELDGPPACMAAGPANAHARLIARRGLSAARPADGLAACVHLLTRWLYMRGTRSCEPGCRRTNDTEQGAHLHTLRLVLHGTAAVPAAELRQSSKCCSILLLLLSTWLCTRALTPCIPMQHSRTFRDAPVGSGYAAVPATNRSPARSIVPVSTVSGPSSASSNSTAASEAVAAASAEVASIDATLGSLDGSAATTLAGCAERPACNAAWCRRRL